MTTRSHFVTAAAVAALLAITTGAQSLAGSTPYPTMFYGDESTTLANGTETTIVTANASHPQDLLLLLLTNQTATAVRVAFRDTTGGAVRFYVNLAPQGGAVIEFPAPVKAAAKNTNWTAQLSAGGISVDVFAQYTRRGAF